MQWKLFLLAESEESSCSDLKYRCRSPPALVQDWAVVVPQLFLWVSAPQLWCTEGDVLPLPGSSGSALPQEQTVLSPKTWPHGQSRFSCCQWLLLS